MTDMAPKNEVCKVNPEDCSKRFDSIDSKFEKVVEKIEDIHNRLFVGNGKPSYETRIDRLEQTEKGRSKITWLFIAAFVVVIVNQGWGLLLKMSDKQQQQTQTGKP